MGSLDMYYHRVYHGPAFKPGEEMQYEVLRLASFDKWPLWALKRPGDLADNGFYYCGHSDAVKCYACGGQISNWSVNEQVQQEHSKRYPNCPFVAGHATNLKLGTASVTISKQGAKASAGKDVFGSGERELDSLADIPDSGFGAVATAEMKMRPALQQTNNISQVEDMLEQLHTLPSVTSSDHSSPTHSTEPTPDTITETDLNLVKYENYRLRTFEGRWPENSFLSPVDLAKAGFYYRGTGDNVQCAFCKGRLLNWKPTDNAMSEHRRHYPNCSFVQGGDVGNVTAESEETSKAQMPVAETKKTVTPSERLGIMMDKPKHPEYAIESNRVDTFKTWPKRSVITPVDLARAGFFYVGYSDNVKCFFCDGGLRNWDHGDDPWQEHTRWFSKCGFLKLNLSDEYIEKVLQQPRNTGSLETHSHNLGPPPPKEPGPVDPRVLRARMDTPMIRNIMEMGFSKELIRKVLGDRLQNTGDDFPSAEAILQALINETDDQKEEAGAAAPAEPNKASISRRKKRNRNKKKKKKNQQLGMGVEGVEMHGEASASPEPEMEDEEEEEEESSDPRDAVLDPHLTEDEELRSLAQQYSRIKEERTCKICMDAECSIVFLPCGHLVCCSSCAPALRTCPICRTFIKGSVRIFTT